MASNPVIQCAHSKIAEGSGERYEDAITKYIGLGKLTLVSSYRDPGEVS